MYNLPVLRHKMQLKHKQLVHQHDEDENHTCTQCILYNGSSPYLNPTTLHRWSSDHIGPLAKQWRAEAKRRVLYYDSSRALEMYMLRWHKTRIFILKFSPKSIDVCGDPSRSLISRAEIHQDKWSHLFLTLFSKLDMPNVGNKSIQNGDIVLSG